MTERDTLELIIARCEEYFAAQRVHENNRLSKVDKKLMHESGEVLASIIKQLRKNGFNGDRFKTNTKQNKFF